MADMRYVTRRGNRYYWQRKGFPLYRLPDDPKERERLATACNRRADYESEIARLPKHRPTGTTRALVFERTKANAKQRGIAFGLTYDDVCDLFERAQGRCEVTGIPFDIGRRESGAMRPWAPSVDRIDSSGGYTPDNCRLVCVAVNIALGTWGLDGLVTIADALARKGLVKQPRRPSKRRTRGAEKSNVLGAMLTRPEKIISPQ